MSVRQGRHVLSIPGPTTVPDAVLGAMHRPAVDIYAGGLVSVTETCLADLRTVFGTAGEVYIYIANGHGAWEAALANTLSAGDRVLVLESGAFAVSWDSMASGMGIEVEVLEGRPGRAVDPAALEARLEADTDGAISAVLVVQVDTASSVVNDIAALRKAIDAAGHDALFMVDTIASLATTGFPMDDWGVDVAVGGSQKGLMLPPGLGFTACNARAKARHATAGLRTRYWDWSERDGPEHYMKYCGTPPEHMLFGLRQSLDMLLEEGLDHAARRHRLLAEAVRAAVAAWAEGGVLGFNISEPAERADSVTTVTVAEGTSPADILAYCEENCGVTVGIGIGGMGDRAFRIAHMGHVNAPMVLGTLGSIEMALIALGIPHGPGVTAAVRALGESVPA